MCELLQSFTHQNGANWVSYNKSNLRQHSATAGLIMHREFEFYEL